MPPKKTAGKKEKKAKEGDDKKKDGKKKVKEEEPDPPGKKDKKKKKKKKDKAGNEDEANDDDEKSTPAVNTDNTPGFSLKKYLGAFSCDLSSLFGSNKPPRKQYYKPYNPNPVKEGTEIVIDEEAEARERERLRLLEEERIRNKHATAIQRHIRGFLGRIRGKRQWDIAIEAAQAYWENYWHIRWLEYLERMKAKNARQKFIQMFCGLAMSGGALAFAIKTKATTLIQKTFRGYRVRKLDLLAKPPMRPKFRVIPSRFSSAQYRRVWARSCFVPNGGWPVQPSVFEYPDLQAYADHPPKGRDFGIRTKKVIAQPRTVKERTVLLNDKNAWVGLPIAFDPAELTFQEKLKQSIQQDNLDSFLTISADATVAKEQRRLQRQNQLFHTLLASTPFSQPYGGKKIKSAPSEGFSEMDDWGGEHVGHEEFTASRSKIVGSGQSLSVSLGGRNPGNRRMAGKKKPLSKTMSELGWKDNGEPYSPSGFVRTMSAGASFFDGTGNSGGIATSGHHSHMDDLTYQPDGDDQHRENSYISDVTGMIDPNEMNRSVSARADGLFQSSGQDLANSTGYQHVIHSKYTGKSLHMSTPARGPKKPLTKEQQASIILRSNPHINLSMEQIIAKLPLVEKKRNGSGNVIQSDVDSFSGSVNRMMNAKYSNEMPSGKTSRGPRSSGGLGTSSTTASTLIAGSRVVGTRGSILSYKPKKASELGGYGYSAGGYKQMSGNTYRERETLDSPNPARGGSSGSQNLQQMSNLNSLPIDFGLSAMDSFSYGDQRLDQSDGAVPTASDSHPGFGMGKAARVGSPDIRGWDHSNSNLNNSQFGVDSQQLSVMNQHGNHRMPRSPTRLVVGSALEANDGASVSVTSHQGQGHRPSVHPAHQSPHSGQLPSQPRPNATNKSSSYKTKYTSAYAQNIKKGKSLMHEKANAIKKKSEKDECDSMDKNQSFDSSMSYFKNSAWGKVKDRSLKVYPHVEAINPFPITTPMTALQQQSSILSSSQFSEGSGDPDPLQVTGHVSYPHEHDKGLIGRTLFHKKVPVVSKARVWPKKPVRHYSLRYTWLPQPLLQTAARGHWAPAGDVKIGTAGAAAALNNKTIGRNTAQLVTVSPTREDASYDISLSQQDSSLDLDSKRYDPSQNIYSFLDPRGAVKHKPKFAVGDNSTQEDADFDPMETDFSSYEYNSRTGYSKLLEQPHYTSLASQSTVSVSTMPSFLTSPIAPASPGAQPKKKKKVDMSMAGEKISKLDMSVDVGSVTSVSTTSSSVASPHWRRKMPTATSKRRITREEEVSQQHEHIQTLPDHSFHTDAYTVLGHVSPHKIFKGKPKNVGGSTIDNTPLLNGRPLPTIAQESSVEDTSHVSVEMEGGPGGYLPIARAPSAPNLSPMSRPGLNRGFSDDLIGANQSAITLDSAFMSREPSFIMGSPGGVSAKMSKSTKLSKSAKFGEVNESLKDPHPYHWL